MSKGSSSGGFAGIPTGREIITVIVPEGGDSGRPVLRPKPLLTLRKLPGMPREEFEERYAFEKWAQRHSAQLLLPAGRSRLDCLRDANLCQTYIERPPIVSEDLLRTLEKRQAFFRRHAEPVRIGLRTVLPETVDQPSDLIQQLLHRNRMVLPPIEDLLTLVVAQYGATATHAIPDGVVVRAVGGTVRRDGEVVRFELTGRQTPGAGPGTATAVVLPLGRKSVEIRRRDSLRIRIREWLKGL